MNNIELSIEELETIIKALKVYNSILSAMDSSKTQETTRIISKINFSKFYETREAPEKGRIK